MVEFERGVNDLDFQSKLNEIKQCIVKRQKIKMKNTNQEYLPIALRLSNNSLTGWLYSVECIEEKTNSVIHIRLVDAELQEGV